MTTEKRRSSDANREGWGLDTLLIHANQEPDPQTGAIVPPIHPSSTFVRQRIDDDARFRYARGANPTREALEAILAGLEHGAGAVGLRLGDGGGHGGAATALGGRPRHRRATTAT